MPTDDLIPDWRVQLTVNVGPYSDLRLRADTVADLAEILNEVDQQLADRVASTYAFFNNVKTVAEGTGGRVQVISDSPAESSGGNPHCAHGERQYVTKANWQAFFCPLGRDAKGKCDPIFKNNDNKDQYPWP